MQSSDVYEIQSQLIEAAVLTELQKGFVSLSSVCADLIVLVQYACILTCLRNSLNTVCVK